MKSRKKSLFKKSSQSTNSVKQRSRTTQKSKSTKQLVSKAQQSSPEDDNAGEPSAAKDIAEESSAAEDNGEELVDSLKKFRKFSDDTDAEALLQSLTTGQLLRKPQSDGSESDHEYEKAVAETSRGLRPKGKAVKGKAGLKLRERLSAKVKGKTVSFYDSS